MANSRLAALTGLSTPASLDEFYINDVSDTTDDASGSSKKITFGNLIESSTVTMTNKTLTSPTITSPTITGTDSGAETLVNKTLTAPTIADFTNAAHDH